MSNTSTSVPKGVKKAQVLQFQPQGKRVEGANDSVNVDDIVANGDKYIDAVVQHIDNLKNLWVKQDNVDLMPTPFFKSMLFFEAVSYSYTSLIYELAMSLKDAPGSVQEAVKKSAPSLHKWLQSIKDDDAGNKISQDTDERIMEALRKVTITKPLPTTTTIRNSDRYVQEIIEKYYPHWGKTSA